MIEEQIRQGTFDEKPGARKEQHWEITWEYKFPTFPWPANIRHNGKGGIIGPISEANKKHKLVFWMTLGTFAPVATGILIAATINFAATIMKLFQ